MDIFNPTKYQYFPADSETWDFLQNITKQVSKLALLGGENYILTGCTVNGTAVTDGWVVIGGEILPFSGGTLQTTVIIDETPDPVSYQNIDYSGLYVRRTARFGTGANTVNFADFKRFEGFADAKHTHTATEITDLAAALTTEWIYVKKEELWTNWQQNSFGDAADSYHFLRYKKSITGLVTVQGYLYNDEVFNEFGIPSTIFRMPEGYFPKRTEGTYFVSNSFTAGFSKALPNDYLTAFGFEKGKKIGTIGFLFSYYVD